MFLLLLYQEYEAARLSESCAKRDVDPMWSLGARAVLVAVDLLKGIQVLGRWVFCISTP